jgi:tetratricopeptide (TPR) repeat protein
VIEGEVAQAIAAQVRIKLTPEQAKMVAGQRLTSPEAVDAYLQGRYFWNKRTGQGLKKAIQYFNQAIAKQPDYGAAYAGLADSYLLLGGYYIVPQSESIPRAKAAARKALEMDSSLADAHATLGLIAMNFDWNWGEAERQYRQAIAINPNYATAHHWYAEYLTAVGRFDEGLAEIGVAEQLDPLSLIISSDHCKYLYVGRKYDSAIKQCQAAIEMDPSFVLAHSWLAQAEITKGMFSEGIAELERVRAHDDTEFLSAMLVYAYAVAGRRSEAEKELERLKHDSKHDHVDPVCFVVGYLGLGNNEQAFAWLEREYTEHSVGLTAMKVNPLYDPLRSDPRFVDLMRRVGLQP